MEVSFVRADVCEGVRGGRALHSCSDVWQTCKSHTRALCVTSSCSKRRRSGDSWQLLSVHVALWILWLWKDKPLLIHKHWGFLSWEQAVTQMLQNSDISNGRKPCDALLSNNCWTHVSHDHGRCAVKQKLCCCSLQCNPQRWFIPLTRQETILYKSKSFLVARVSCQVILVSANKLTRYIEPCQLTDDFGGSLDYDHSDWLNKRLVTASFILY